VLPQERAQPAGADGHPRLLLQIDRQTRGSPHIEGQAQRAWRRLQRRFHGRQIRLVRSHRATAAPPVAKRSHPTLGKAGQPMLHGCDRAPAPARDPLQLVAQRRGFDHLQPLAQAPRHIRALQLPLDVLALLRRNGDAPCPHLLAPSVPLGSAPSAPPRTPAYPPFDEFTSAYLALRARAGAPAEQQADRHDLDSASSHR
jgi:hypothetical protein